MHKDNVIILGGNTSNNIKWLEKLKSVYAKNYNVSTLFFDNWKDNTMIDFNKEGQKLIKLCEEKENYIIIAKSAGAILAAQEIKNNNITPNILIVMGMPLKFSLANQIDIKSLFNDISKKCKILIIQQKFDPQGSAKEISEMFNKNILVKTINGNKHVYANFLLIKKEIELFINSNNL